MRQIQRHHIIKRIPVAVICNSWETRNHKHIQGQNSIQSPVDSLGLFHGSVQVQDNIIAFEVEHRNSKEQGQCWRREIIQVIWYFGFCLMVLNAVVYNDKH